MDTALLYRASTDRLSKIAKDLFLFAIAADQQTALDATNAKVRAEFARLAPTVKGDGLRDAAATDRDALRREATEMLHQAANASPAELEAIEVGRKGCCPGRDSSSAHLPRTHSNPANYRPSVFWFQYARSNGAVGRRVCPTAP